VYGAFVSVSISGEILVWDAQNFVPVFATYSHVYSPGGSDGGKSVATIQCTDLPKSPEGCPYGSALLALGLGGGGVDSGGRRGGVIQLCDAFRGGSATHELIGHSRNAGGGGGGVNAIAWDPHHPFRLASGGNDCTIRLWDIRKAGAAACLGVLNRESGDTNGRGGYAAEEIYNNPCTSSTRKKQKACISMVGTSRNNISTMNGIESHEAPVTAITFAPYGDDLVSASLDGQIKHWDLRPDSCFTSSFAAVRENNKCTSSNSSVGGGGGDPSVAVGGHLLPTLFYSGDNKAGGCATTPTLPSQRQIRHPNSASLAIIQPGSRTTATLLSTANKNGCSSIGQITGYSLLGRRGKEPGGYPDFVLDGHLADVTCLVPVVGTWDNLAGGRCNDGGGTVAANNRVVFLTGGKDGMVLCWGHSRGCRSRDLVRSISDMSSPSSSSTLHEQKRPLEDVDTW
jgi:WD40 repeat protein